MKGTIKCLLGLHEYTVLYTKEIHNPYNVIIGFSIISRCNRCGKIKETVIYTDSHYKH